MNETTPPIEDSQEAGCLPRTGSGLDARELGVVRGLITALAAFTVATPEFILKALTGVLFTAEEAQDIRGPNAITPPE